jgi:hypothetical protein
VQATDRSLRGFTTLELLIASALLLVVTAAIASLVQPVGDSVQRSLGRSDLTGGARAVLDRLSAEIREAGSPAAVAIDRVQPARVTDVVAPLSDLAAQTGANPGHAIRIVRVPPFARQGLLRETVAAGSVFLPLDEAGSCTALGPGCGFLPGATALLHDEASAVFVTTTAIIDPGIVQVTSPIPMAFGAGAVLAEVSSTMYGLRSDVDGSNRLVRVSQSVDQPVIQQVVEFTVRTSGPDPTRPRVVEFRLRLQAPAHLRGPAGVLFRQPGTSTRARAVVPDVEWNTLVALRQAAP